MMAVESQQHPSVAGLQLNLQPTEDCPTLQVGVGQGFPMLLYSSVRQKHYWAQAVLRTLVLHGGIGPATPRRRRQ